MRARSPLLRLAALVLTAGAMLGGAACSLVAGLDKLEFTDAEVCAEVCDDENVCTDHDCRVDGMCKGTPLADGPAPLDVKGDCQHVTCAGGTAQTSIDDGDVPADDGSSCTVEQCQGGEPSAPALPDGQTCPRPGPVESGVCEGGLCLVPCTSDAVCDDQNPCTADACDLDKSVCRNPALDAVPTPGLTPVPGDCRVHRCVKGVDTDVVDDTDVVANVNECAVASCKDGAPVTTSAKKGQPCTFGGGKVCDGNQACVACNEDDECSVDDECHTPKCNDNKTCGSQPVAKGVKLKNAPQIDGDCFSLYCDGLGKTYSAVDDQDAPDDGTTCTVDTCDAMGTPVHTPVPAGELCDMGGGKCTATGQCGCANDTQCKSPNTCGGGGMMFTCGCTKKTCAGLGLTCGQTPDGCYATLNCNSGTKNGAETDVDCGGGAAGCTTKCTMGKTCKAGTDCASGFCADGVCCNTACNGACVACNLPALVGTCSGLAAGTTDGALCAAPSACDGAGACKKPTGSTCALNTDCMGGFCADGVCCASACKTPCKVCNNPGSLGVCGNVAVSQHDNYPTNACAGVNFCDGAGSCKFGAGQPCNKGTDCLSGVCTAALVCQ